MGELVQVWVPYFWTSPVEGAFSRDLQRAYSLWRGEDRVWLVPESQRISRWSVVKWGYPFKECSIPSETFNLLLICHVDESGRTYPCLQLPQTWGRRLPEGLYQHWLNARPVLVDDQESTLVEMPVISEGKVRYEDRRIGIELSPVMAIPDVDPKQSTLTIAFPEAGRGGLPVVSPEEDGGRFFGRLEGGRVLSDRQAPAEKKAEQETGMIPVNVWIQWPEPFDILFPTGAGADLVYHHSLMRRFVKQWSEGKQQKVLCETEAWVDRLTGETETTLYKAWYLPKALSNPQEALFAVDGRFGFAADSLADLNKSPDFLKTINQTTRVRRVVGWLGYFWLEFYREIRAATGIGVCQYCGNIIRGGHADRKYCAPSENADCFRRRNAEAQRRRWARAKAKRNSG